MIGETGFDVARLFKAPEFGVFSEAAVAALEAETATPLREAIEREDTTSRRELAAFAASIQGVAPFLGTLPDAGSLPADVAAFLATERETSAARAEVLRRTLLETVAVLEFEEIGVVALKGAVLAFRDEPEPGLRPMGDLDLLLTDPARLLDATRLLAARGWRVALDTPRHRVFAREDERVVRPACEDPRNPVRVELHVSFRLPVLGRTYDATAALLAAAEPFDAGGERVLGASGNAFLRHLLLHAAEDFAARGLRGIQAHDFRRLARRTGPIRLALSPADTCAGLAPLAYAADAVERLFPQSFDAAWLASLRASAPGRFLARAAGISPLRHTRPLRGWSATALSLVESPGRKARFLARTLFPTPGEVKANVAPDAAGAALAAAWLRVFLSRVAGAVRRQPPASSP